MEAPSRIANIKNKFEKIISRFTEILQESPVEILISLFTFMYATGVHEEVITTNTKYGFLMPLFFVFSFVVNRIFITQKHRLVYYLSLLPFLLFWWINVDTWIWSAGYAVAIIIAGLFLFSFKQNRENNTFVTNAVQYTSEITGSLFLMMAAYALIVSIYFSLKYIFNITETDREFWTYSSLFIFVVGWPLTFLMLHNDSEENDENMLINGEPSIFTILLNYLISPALLIYTAILYLYFIKILVLWSLPKGGIAYMVFAFVLVAVIAGACQPLLKKQPYKWFYNYFSFISLPALLMFWIGVMYRVKQYGLTEDRVYLLVCGLVMTLCMILFFTKQFGRYLYVTWAAIFLLACFTYIPGITANDISIYSQKMRINQTIKELGLVYKDGQLKRDTPFETDTKYLPEYRSLYGSIVYIYKRMGEEKFQKMYGYSNPDAFLDAIVPPVLHADITHINTYARYEQVSYPARYMEIEEYKTFCYPREIHCGENATYEIKGKSGKPIVSGKMSELLDNQLSKIGYSRKNLSIQNLYDNAAEFLTIKTDSALIIINRMDFRIVNDVWTINDLQEVVVFEK